MKPKRILYLLKDYPQLSQTYVEAELRALKDRYEIKIIPYDRSNVEYNNHQPYEHIPYQMRDKFVEAIQSFKPDILHGHYTYLTPWLIAASRLTGAPFTVRAHSYDVIGPSYPPLLKSAPGNPFARPYKHVLPS